MASTIRPWLSSLFPVVLTALAACAPPQPLHPELPRLQVTTAFGLKNLCGLGVSPAIDVANAPAGTARYRVRMTNMSVLLQSAWQDTLPASQNGVAEGAASTYPPPCMGTFQQYAYRFEVMALDAADRPLAYGQATATAVTLDRLVRQARNTAKPPAAATPGSPPPQIIEREDENDLFGTLPYRNYGPVVAPQPTDRTE